MMTEGRKRRMQEVGREGKKQKTDREEEGREQRKGGRRSRGGG